MSGPGVSIRRLSATAHVGRGRDDAVRVARLLDGVARRRLDAALQSLPLPPGMWCLRRVEVPVRLDLDGPEPSVEEAWAVALAAGIGRALADPRRAHRYTGVRDALSDLVAGMATARLDRTWAWTQVDVLRRDGPDPRTAPRDALLAALGLRPQHAPGALVLAAERVGLPALHRCLCAEGWGAIARLVTERSGQSRAIAGPPSGVPRRTEGEAAERLARRLVDASVFAAAVRRSALRPDPVTLHAWAVLVCAEADPSVFGRSAAGTVLAEVATTLATGSGPRRVGRERPSVDGFGELDPAHTVGDAEVGHAGAPAPSPTKVVEAGRLSKIDGAGASVAGLPNAPGPGRTGESPLVPGSSIPSPRREGQTTAAGLEGFPVDPTGGSTARAPSGEKTTAEVVSVGSADAAVTADHRYDTDYAALLFLLATASAAGVPGVVLDEARLAARPLPWVLHAVARHMGVPGDDAAAATFAGLDPGRRLPWTGEHEATTAEQDALVAIAQRWSQVTAAAMGRLDRPPLDVVAGVIARSGVIAWAPGWVDVCLSLERVDVDIRRAGLDLDPGWVPWLGTVVRYLYE
jgi:hypothetical protein